MKKVLLLATATLFMGAVSFADCGKGKGKKCSKQKTCCKKSDKSCCKDKTKTAKL